MMNQVIKTYERNLVKMINRVQNPSKMTFNVEVKMIKHPFWSALITVIAGFAILAFLFGSGTFILIYTDNKILSVILTLVEIAILAIIMSRKKRGKDFMIMDDNLDTFIKNNKTSRQLSFNLMDLYMNRCAEIINYTYSNTILIQIKKLYGYEVSIRGDRNVRDYLVPRFRVLGIQVMDRDDEPDLDFD